MNNTREIYILTMLLTHVYYKNKQRGTSPSPLQKRERERRKGMKKKKTKCILVIPPGVLRRIYIYFYGSF